MMFIIINFFLKNKKYMEYEPNLRKLLRLNKK